MSGHTYIPPAFQQDDPERLAATVSAHPLGLLMLGGLDTLEAVHLPFLRVGERDDPAAWHFQSHLARANPVAKALSDGRECPGMLVFTGPDAYVSPHWYVDARESSVPTWNYQAVHVRGRARLLGEDAADWLDGHLHDLIATQQARIGQPPFDYSHLPDERLAAMKAAIVGIELTVETIEGIEKLSQNKSAADRAGVIEGLRARGDAECAAMAELMRQREQGTSSD
ncbi:FMN-binding negative transcriptional regulator [Guyparkeria hydrothermalis]|uniref:FMN-binding negative transcriptional regulator n=1 Tax=Guyparkeria hydrothermalis TaxID=923 RepID=UPI00202136DD|nr:FMN-binding negative transcriptional regulator [Guyparkeria hydrothermalis]MCL7743800.1 FMN-binding negative transcriptional regulator [Guyparkeria hydrothermalis]